jgi:hypothetical protein
VPREGPREPRHWCQAVAGRPDSASVRRKTTRCTGRPADQAESTDLLVQGSGVLSDDSWYSCRRTPSHCRTDHSWRLILWFIGQGGRDGSQPSRPGRKGRRCCRRRRLRRWNRALRQAVDQPAERSPWMPWLRTMLTHPHRPRSQVRATFPRPARRRVDRPGDSESHLKPSSDCHSLRTPAGSWMSGWRDCSARRSPPAFGNSYSGRSTLRW